MGPACGPPGRDTGTVALSQGTALMPGGYPVTVAVFTVTLVARPPAAPADFTRPGLRVDAGSRIADSD